MEKSLKSDPSLNITTSLYPNGKLAVYLKDEFGMPLAELSINNDLVELAANEFILKDYSENQLLVDDLLNSGIIKPTDRFIIIRNHLYPICIIQN